MFLGVFYFLHIVLFFYLFKFNLVFSRCFFILALVYYLTLKFNMFIYKFFCGKHITFNIFNFYYAMEEINTLPSVHDLKKLSKLHFVTFSKHAIKWLGLMFLYS